MSGFSVVFAAGLSAFLLAGIVDLVGGARHDRLRASLISLGGAGAACLAAAGAAHWPASGQALGSGLARAGNSIAGRGPAIRALPDHRVQRGIRGVPGFRGLGRPPGRGRAPWPRRQLCADTRRGRGFHDSQGRFTALLAWELMTIAFYLLAGFERGRAGRPGGALITLAFGKVSGAALLLGLLLLAVRSGSLDLGSFAHVPQGAARDAAQALLIAGFAVKVGLVPFQVWLPRGYAGATPAPPGRSWAASP